MLCCGGAEAECCCCICELGPPLQKARITNIAISNTTPGDASATASLPSGHGNAQSLRRDASLLSEAAENKRVHCSSSALCRRQLQARHQERGAAALPCAHLLNLSPSNEPPVLLHPPGERNLLALLGAHRRRQLQLRQIALHLQRGITSIQLDTTSGLAAAANADAQFARIHSANKPAARSGRWAKIPEPDKTHMSSRAAWAASTMVWSSRMCSRQGKERISPRGPWRRCTWSRC